MKISCSIMAHPDRATQANRLAGQLAAPISWDRDQAGETVNGDNAWRLHDPAADWHIVLQDDAQPIDGFLDHAQAALTHADRGLVSFYVGTGRPFQLAIGNAVNKADSRNAAWLQHTALLWGVAAAMPVPMISAFHRWGAAHPDGAYDKRLTRWTFTSLRMPVQYTWPCLVDHEDGPTLLEHPWGPPKTPRKAWRVGVPEKWDTPVVAIT